jgi:hypothetical protein
MAGWMNSGDFVVVIYVVEPNMSFFLEARRESAIPNYRYSEMFLSIQFSSNARDRRRSRQETRNEQKTVLHPPNNKGRETLAFPFVAALHPSMATQYPFMVVLDPFVARR